MKLIVFLCLIIVLVIPVNISVHAQNPVPPAQEVHLQADPNATYQLLQQQIQQNEYQRDHYLQIIQSLVTLSIVLGFVVIGLGVILYKKRNLKMKSNPES